MHANVPVANVKNVIIWGNHSSTQFPDARHAKVVKGKHFFSDKNCMIFTYIKIVISVCADDRQR